MEMLIQGAVRIQLCLQFFFPICFVFFRFYNKEIQIMYCSVTEINHKKNMSKILPKLNLMDSHITHYLFVIEKRRTVNILT